MMPQDVSTWWNSTFNMLEFAIQYHMAIDAMTAVREFNLHKYELASIEWNTHCRNKFILTSDLCKIIYCNDSIF